MTNGSAGDSASHCRLRLSMKRKPPPYENQKVTPLTSTDMSFRLVRSICSSPKEYPPGGMVKTGSPLLAAACSSRTIGLPGCGRRLSTARRANAGSGSSNGQLSTSGGGGTPVPVLSSRADRLSGSPLPVSSVLNGAVGSCPPRTSMADNAHRPCASSRARIGRPRCE
eukprot:scaffold16305_cov124-Isochrysis_galbana.AAC.7